MDFDKFKYFGKSEKMVNILKDKCQSEETLFFRVLVSYYFTKMSSTMRTNIVTLDRGVIPTNMYALNLATSGFGKGRSINIMENEVLDKFKTTFMEDTLPSIADGHISKLAIQRASKLGTDQEEMYNKICKEYADTGAHLFNFDSGTGPAVKQLRHQLLLASAGSINLEMDEVGANLSNNIEVLNTFIELYDVGKVKPKIIKSTKENVRSQDISGSTPTNMLLFGTPSKLLDGGRVENDFYNMLDMGYARRLLFSYVPYLQLTNTKTAEELFALATDSATLLTLTNLSKEFGELAEKANFGREVLMNKENTIELIKYQQYCQERAFILKEHQEMEKAEMTHRYFKVLKLAGVYAFIDKVNEISLEHLQAAMKLVEESGTAFKSILQRDKAYVKLAKYIASIGKEVTSVDLIEDLPFYRGSESQKRDLLSLATAYGYKNNIVIKKSYIDGIEFLKGESLQTTNTQQLTISGSREPTYNYGKDIVSLEQLQEFVITPDLHFTAHHWDTGHRNKDNLIVGFDLLILDIDKGTSLKVAKELLSDFTYIIYTTKRHTETNNRFRIILPMSHKVELSSQDYSRFMENVFAWLPFDVDEATKDVARKWTTHAGERHMNTGELIDALLFIPQTKKAIDMTHKRQQVSSMSGLQAWFFRKITNGNRSAILLRYGLTMVDCNVDIETIRNNLLTFNAGITEPITESEINKTIMVTVTKTMAERGLL